MFHRELKINFGELEEAAEALQYYIRALEQLAEGLAMIWKALEGGEGKAYEALRAEELLITGQVEKELEAAKGTCHILKSYIADMTSVITPELRGQPVLVDRNDIWANMMTMAERISRLDILDYYIIKPWGNPYTLPADEETKTRERRYYERVKSVREDVIVPYRNRIAAAMCEIQDIYESRIIPYENMDDDYVAEAREAYQKYTDMWGTLRDSLEQGLEEGIDFVAGACKGVWDAAAGVVSLAAGVFYTAGAGITWGFCELFSLDTPEWAFNRLWNVEERREAVLKDPMLIVEGVSQGAADAVEQKGTAYCTGYITGSIITDIGIAKGVKALSSKIAAKKPAKVTVETDPSINSLNHLDDVTKGTSNVADDIGRTSGVAEDVGQVVAEGGTDVWDMTEGGGIINGREYSQHAMERMAPDTPSVRAELSRRAEALAESKGLQVGSPEYYQFCQKYVDPRNIPPSVIEDAIRNTTAVPGHTAGTFVHQTADVTVIVNEMGKVITVIPK